MGINITGTCDMCNDTVELQSSEASIIGESAHMITLEDISYNNKTEALVCPKCWKIVKKALDSVMG